MNNTKVRIKKNKRIRMKLLEYDLTQYDLSKILEVSEMTIYRRLRDELPEEEQGKIVNMIEQSQGDHAHTEMKKRVKKKHRTRIGDLIRPAVREAAAKAAEAQRRQS